MSLAFSIHLEPMITWIVHRDIAAERPFLLPFSVVIILIPQGIDVFLLALKIPHWNHDDVDGV